MEPEDIGRIVSASDPKVSPDGATVAYVVSRVDLEANRYRSAIWLAATDGSSAPYQFSAGEHGDVGPEWSPDGRRLAFTSRRSEDKDGKRTGTLHVAPVSIPGEVVTLAERDEGFGELAWSPDGARLAFTSREPTEKEDDDRKRPPRKIERLFSRLDSVGWTIDRPSRVFVVPVDGSTGPRIVTGGPYEAGSPTWAPDSRRLAFVSARHDDFDLTEENDLFVVDVDATGDDASEPPEPRRVTATDRDWFHPAWEPDGERIAALTRATLDAGLFGDVAVVDVESGAVDVLTGSFDKECAPYPGARPPVWADDHLVVTVEDHGATHLYRVSLGGGDPEVVVDGARSIDGFDRAAGTLAYASTTPTTVSEVFVSVGGGAEQALSDVGAGFHRAFPARPAQHFAVACRDGAGEVDAWIVAPEGVDLADGSARHPMLLSIHGGPHTQYGLRWFDEFQLWASAGYIVVFANPRGSTGQTEDWARAIRSPSAKLHPGSGWGGVDHEDLMAVVDAALERFPAIDPDRLGVLGGSYGGYMTSWILGHTDRFAAGCSERAVNNLLTLETASDAAGLFRFVFGVSHLEAHDEYRSHSPITYVDDIHTPVLILHSENDLRCPIEQADQLFVALRLLGREQEYHRFPAESHELSRSGSPRHRVQRAELILDFFGRKLRGTADDDTAVPSTA
jgi:dipeptidyl aminopeptidase/acylaminoacyl peptidase